MQVLDVAQAEHLIGSARAAGSRLADPLDWNKGQVEGVLISADDLKELTRLAGKQDTGLFGIPFLEQGLNLLGEAVGGIFGVPIPAGTLVAGGAAAAEGDVGALASTAESLIGGPAGLDLGIPGLPPGLVPAAAAPPAGGSDMGLFDTIGGFVNQFAPGLGDILTDPFAQKFEPQFGAGGELSGYGNILGQAEASPVLGGASGDFGPPAPPGTAAGTGGSTMYGTSLSDAMILTGAGRLRTIPLSALQTQGGGVMIPRGFHVKNLPARRATAGRAPGAYAVRNRHTNYLNLHALRRASARLTGATRIVRHLFTLPKHTIRAKHRRARGGRFAKR